MNSAKIWHSSWPVMLRPECANDEEADGSCVGGGDDGGGGGDDDCDDDDCDATGLHASSLDLLGILFLANKCSICTRNDSCSPPRPFAPSTWPLFGSLLATNLKLCRWRSFSRRRAPLPFLSRLVEPTSSSMAPFGLRRPSSAAPEVVGPIGL